MSVTSKSKKWSLFATALTAAAALGGTASAQSLKPELLSRAEATQAVDIDVYFPARNLDELETLTASQVDPSSSNFHRWLTPERFRARYGAEPADVAAVTEQLAKAGFRVTGNSALGLHLAGTVGAVEQAFGTTIHNARFADGSTGLTGAAPLAMTGALARAGAHVPQFAGLPPLRRHSLSLPIGAGDGVRLTPQNVYSAVGPYYTADLRQAYGFPSATVLNGKGIVIGVLMSGNFQQSDMTLYWQAQLLPSVAPALVPTVTSVAVGGGSPFSTSNSVETHLDIQQSAGMALGSKVILYNLRDLSDAQVMAGLTQIDEDDAVAVVNMSFGGPEATYTALGASWILTVRHSLFLQGNAQGITFVASSGDNAGNPYAVQCTAGTCTQKSTKTPEAPADDPAVTAVGGTNLVTTYAGGGNTRSAYVRENAYPDPLTSGRGPLWGSGGGISTVFGKPAWQKLVQTPSADHRSVPDLALHMGGCLAGMTGFGTCAADRSSDVVVIGGSATQVIGTSASAPDVAGLLALLAKRTTGHRLGNVNPYIYNLAAEQAKGTVSVFHHKAIPGNNGPYKIVSTVPYDPVIGNGTVVGRAFLGIPTAALAGNPGTASNP